MMHCKRTNVVRSARLAFRIALLMRSASGLSSNSHQCAGTAHKSYSPLFPLMPKSPWGKDYIGVGRCLHLVEANASSDWKVNRYSAG
jgi:hypothetical protein